MNPEGKSRKSNIRLWSKVTKGILHSDLNEATTHKLEIEENQRNLLKKRQDENTEWTPRFFEEDALGEWKLKYKDINNEQGLKEFIFGQATSDEYSHFWIK